ncbi:hypothetical protein ACQP2T_39670 [Nonomuraea sp. CA-143628]
MLRLLATGLSNAELAERLSLSPRCGWSCRQRMELR